MSSLNIEYNGKTIPIANVGIVSSKEKVILGNLERDLLLQTLGSVLILVGNKFYELPFNTDGSWSGGNLNIKDIDGLDNLDLSSYSNGTFLYDTKGNVLYLIHNKTLITISGSDDDNQIFLSYINEQKLSGQQKYRLILNAGQFLSSLQDVKLFTVDDVYDGMIVFVNDEKTHYILSNSRYPNEISSWETFYIGNQGGLIKNGLTIKNQSRENLLYLNEIDAMQNGIFNGLKIGSDEKWMKSSVNILDQSLINYNTKEFLIKNLSYKIFHVLNNNIGIRGDASGSDDYNIIAHGSLKMNGPFFTDKKMVSTDFNTINITHWDGGRGFGLTRGSDSKWNLEIDNLIVRDSLVANKMVLKSLEVERAYATGGHILVTDGAVINSYNYRKPTTEELQTANVTYNGNHGILEANSYYYFVTFKESTEKDDNDAYVSLPTTPALPSENNLTDNIEKDTLDVDKNCPFIAGDVLLCQTASGLTAKRYYAYVSYSTNKYIAIKSNHLRNNVIYLRDNEGNPVSIFKDFSIEANDSLIRITNLLTDNEGVYKNKNRRRFIDIDGTRNQITMYDNLGNPNLFSGAPNADGFYDDIEIITGIGQNGSLRLRMGELSDLGINGITGYGLYCDNVLLKGKLIVKDPSGEYPIGATKGAWIPGNTNTYYLNDIISYNGSAYRCIVQHTNTALLLAIPGVSDFWEILVQKGTDGTPGSDFSYVDIVGDQVFIYNSDSGTYDKTMIPLTCTAFNVDYDSLINIKFEWVISGAITYSHTYLKSEVTAGSISDSKNIYVTGINEGVDWSSLWNGDSSLTVSCRVYINDSTDYNSDVFSVYKVQNGADGETPLTGYITNDAISLSADESNNVISYSYANGYFKVFYGLTDVTSSCTFSSTSINCTGSINSSGYYSVTSMIQASTIATLTLNAVYNGITITKEFSLSKSRTGTSAVLYEIKPSAYTVTKSITNTFTPSNITFTFYKTEGASPASYSGYYRTYYSTDGATYSLITSSSGSSASVTPNSTYKSFKCELYTDSGYTNKVDEQSVLVVNDGATGSNSVNGVLTNDAVTVFATNDGIVSDFSYATGLFKMYYGSTDVTSSSTFSSTATNCTGSIAATGVYSITEFTSANNNGYLTLVGTYNGVSITKIFSISKSKTGSSAILYEVKPSVYTVTKSITNTFTPTSVIFSFYKTEGSSTVSYSGYYRTYSSTDGIVYSLITSSSGSSASITPNSAYKSFKCELYTDSSYTTKVDEQSVLVVSDGATGLNSVNGVLTNDAVTVFAETDGTVSDFSYAAGTFKMYYGTTDVTASSIFSSTATNCTGSIASNGVYSITAFPAANNNGFLNLTGTYNGVSITRIFSISKSKTGSTGVDAVIYEIQSSTSTIAKNISNVFSPTSVSFTFYRRYGSGNRSLFTGYYKTFYSTDGVNYTQISSTSGSSASVTPEISYRSIKCDLYSDSGYVNLVDSQTCLIVSDGNTGAAGQDAFTVILSNEAMTVPAMYSGAFPTNIFSDYDYSSNVIVYRGSTKLNYAATSGYSYTVSLLAGSRFSTTISTSGTECKIRINNITQDLSGELYIPDYMVANFYVSILYNNVATGTAFTKTIAVSKAKQGPLLDWIKEWDGASTYVDTYKIISPKMFAGSKSGSNYTGVAIGRDVFGLGSNGIAGFYNSTKTFHLDAATGNCVFGNGNNSISYVANTGGLTFGSAVTMKWSNITDASSVTDKLTKIDANGIYTGSLSADLITAGLIGTERLKINKTLIVGGPSGTESYDGVISVLNANSTPTEVVRLDRNGLYAIAGTIGGFEINSNSIGSNNADSTDRIYLSRNYIRTGKMGHLVAVGLNVIPSGYSGFNVVANSFFQNDSLTTGVDKVGIVILQSNTTGAKNYGLISNATCTAPDFVSKGIHYASLNSVNTGFSNSTLFWLAYPFSLNTRYLLYSYALYTLYLPSVYYLASMFADGASGNFAIELSFTSRPSNGYNIILESTSGAIIYNLNGALSTITLGRGDTVKLLAVNTSDGFYYLIVGFTYG